VTYLLDTDTIIFLLKGNQSVANHIRRVGDEHIATTVINLAELYFGAFNSMHVEENVRAVDGLRFATRIVEFETGAAVIFGKMKAMLKRQGNLVNDSDLLIAAVALFTQSVLVTNNTRHFTRIDGLRCENWVIR
jgi:tRNA(fMet)-specific endonuclease VapC